MDSNANRPGGKPQAATIRYVDQPECDETFADSINSVFFDGQTMRIEFGVTRMDEMKQGQTMTGRRYPACRLVLPVSATVDLINKMQQTANALQQSGVMKPAAPAASTPSAASPAKPAMPAARPLGSSTLGPSSLAPGSVGSGPLGSGSLGTARPSSAGTASTPGPVVPGSGTLPPRG